MKPELSADTREEAVEILPSVARALAVDAGCRFLFVVLSPEHRMDEELRAEIQRGVAARGSVPDAIYAAPDLPCAADGRVLRAAVQRVLAGEPAARVAVEERVTNPVSLAFFAFLFNNL